MFITTIDEGPVRIPIVIVTGFTFIPCILGSVVRRVVEAPGVSIHN